MLDQLLKNPAFAEMYKNAPYLNNVEVQKQYRNASVAAFKTYPTPDYNPQTGKWDYKTKEAKMAAMRAIAGGQ